MTCLCLCCCLATSTQAAQFDTKPCAVFFYGHYSQSELHFRTEVAERFHLELDEPAQRSLERKDFYKYDVPEGFVRREGIAYFLLPGQPELTVVRFVPVPTRKAFDQLVAQTAEMLGKNTSVIGAGSEKTLTPVDGSVEYLRYDPRGIGVVGWSTDLFRLDLDALVDAFAKLEGKHSLFSLRNGSGWKSWTRSGTNNR